MEHPHCAICQKKFCYEGIKKDTRLPDFCPLKTSDSLIQEVNELYQKEEINNFYLQSALTEKEGYDERAARDKNIIIPLKPRIREIAEFAQKINAKQIGMAFCSGLADEAARACAILEGHGIRVYSVICCCGALDKTEVGIPAEYKIRSPKEYEAACNPLLQARLLNRAKTSFNIIVGLCVGHDMLFTKYSEAPVTTLIVKDRFTGHNPVISLYTKYHRFIV